MTNTPAEKVALLIRGATVSDPNPITTKEVIANHHTGKAVPTTSSLQDITTATRTDRDLKGDHMTTFHPTSRDQYVTTYHAELTRLGSKRRKLNGHDINDVVSFAVLRLLKRFDTIVAKHPDPIMFARKSFRNLAYDYHRRDAVQRGEGARNERVVGTLDFGTTNDVVGHFPDFTDEYVDQNERAEQIDQVRDALTDEEYAILESVDGHGLTVTEVAENLGKRRETISKKASKARSHARKTLGPAA